MNHTVAVKGSNSGCLEAKIKINDSEVIRDYIYYEGGQAGGTSTASAIRWCDKDDEIRPATHWSGSSGTGTHCQDNANPICFFQVIMVS